MAAAAPPLYFLTCHTCDGGGEIIETHRLGVRDGQSLEDVAERFIMTMVLEEVGVDALMDRTQSYENSARVETFLRHCSDPALSGNWPSIETNLQFPGLTLYFGCLHASSGD